MLKIKKINEATLQLASNDSGILMELSEHFTFYAEGYKFMPAFKNKMWDGKVRLLNMRNHTIAYGLLGEIVSFCSSRNYKIDFDANLKTKSPSKESLKRFIENLKLSTRGKKISLRDYQENGFIHAMQAKRCLTISPTASGKSAFIYACIRWYLDNSDEDQRVLIIVPTTSLVAQMKGDFADYSQFDDSFDAENDVHEIYSGKEKFKIDSRVVITTWQSAIKLPRDWFEVYGMVIGDESHQFKAKSLNEIMTRLVNAEYRIGTTGTIDNIPCNKLVLIGNFGPINKLISTKELMDNDTLAKLHIHCLVLKYKDELRKIVSKLKYHDELDFIVSYENRNKFIKNLALDTKGNTLILFNYVDKHGKPLHKLIKDSITKNRKIFFISGSTHVDDRESIRAITEKENDAIIVASLGTFSTGVNVRNIHNIVFASPTKSQIRVLQSIGRGLRKSDDGRDTNLYDISDDLCWKKKQNYTFLHARERIKIYDLEQFDYKQYPILLP